MKNWLVRPWRQVFDFHGRTTRREYWLFYFQLLLIVVAMLVVARPLAGADPSGTAALLVSGLFLLFYLFVFIATLSASVRRLHDHDKTGWLYLLTFIPLVGWIFFLIMMLPPGTPGENSYGFDPREGDRPSDAEMSAIFS